MAGDIRMAFIHYEPETDRVAEAPGVADEMAEAARAFASRYLEGVASACAPLTLVVAFDPALVAAPGSGARRLLLARDAPKLARHLLGPRRAGSSVMVVVGPSAVAYDGDEGRLRETACCDVGNAVGLLHPARGAGPIAPLMPWLLQIACETIAYGGGDPEGAPARADRAMARALSGVSASLYDSWNAYGQMLTDHPAWPYLAEATANEARATAAGCDGPSPPDRIAAMSHSALARALHGLGVEVRPGGGP